jgi:hypothetical protein
MIRMLTLFAIVAGLLPFVNAGSQAQLIPARAAAIIEEHYPGWSYRPVHLPNPCDIPNHPGPNSPPVTICNLNGDATSDFVVAIVAGRDSIRAEYFLAVISSGSDFRLFPLDSAMTDAGLGERSIVCCTAGDTVSFFSDDSVITQYARNVVDENHLVFSTDVIEIIPRCEAHWKEVEIHAYVLIGQAVFEFSAAD